MPIQPPVAGFSPELAQLIANDVRRRLGLTPPPHPTPPGARSVVYGKCFAKITDTATVSGIVKHAWKEVRWNFAGSEWEDVPDGKTGTTTANFAISFPDASGAIAEDTAVELTQIEDSATGTNIWLGNLTSLPTPQYQGQVIGASSQNQIGAFFPFAHAIE